MTVPNAGEKAKLLLAVRVYPFVPVPVASYPYPTRTRKICTRVTGIPASLYPWIH